MGTNTAGETLDGNTTIRLRQMGKTEIHSQPGIKWFAGHTRFFFW